MADCWLYIHPYAWASALLVSTEWAIARALICETSNGTDSHAFFVTFVNQTLQTATIPIILLTA